MTPQLISKRIALDRLNLVKELINEIKALPLGEPGRFFSRSAKRLGCRVVPAPQLTRCQLYFLGIGDKGIRAVRSEG